MVGLDDKIVSLNNTLSETMLIYLVFLLLFAFGTFVQKNDRVGLFLILLLFLLVIFRAESVGSDTWNYINSGLSEYSTGLKTQQFLYAFLTSVKGGGRSHLLIVTFATCTFLGIIIASKRFGVKPVSAFFFFIIIEYLNQSLNIARQYAATGILLIAYSYLFEQGKKSLYFFPLVFIASGLHSVAYVCIPLYFLRYVDFSKIKGWVLIVVFTMVYVVYHMVLKDYYLTLMHTMELSQDIEAYSLYFDQADNMELSIGGFIIALSMQVICIYIFMILRKEKSHKSKILASMLFVSILLEIFFSELYGNIGRIRLSVDIINIVAFSYYFFKLKDRNKIIIAPLILLIYGYSYISLIMGQAYGTSPYKFDFWLI